MLVEVGNATVLQEKQLIISGKHVNVKVGRVLLISGKGSVSTTARTGQCLFEEIKGSSEPQEKCNILLNVALPWNFAQIAQSLV